MMKTQGSVEDRTASAPPVSRSHPDRIQWLLSWSRKSTLLRDTAHLTVSQGLRLAIQAAYFVLLARSLGVNAYGSFIAITAIAALLAPFSCLGHGPLFIRDVRSGGQDPALCWGNGIVITLILGTLLTLGAVLTSVLIGVGSEITVLVAICVSDLVLMRLVELSTFGFAASNQMKESAIQNVVLVLLRLLGIGLLMIFTQHVTLLSWAIAYFLASLLGLVYAFTRGALLWGLPRPRLPHLKGNLVMGLYFSVGVAAATIYNDIDKVMLARLADLASTGIYGAAYRIVDVSMAPIRSLVFAANPIFYEKGVLGVRPNYRYAKRLITRSMICGIAIAIVLWWAAPVLPMVLGESYRPAAPALRVLSVIPFLRSIHAFLADALSGSGYQAIRMVIQVAVALLNIGLNLVILPQWSWRGAAWTSVVCDGSLALALWLTVRWCSLKEDRRARVLTNAA